MHLRDIVLSFDTCSNGASTSKRAGMKKVVWVSRSVDLQSKSEELLQNFNFFQKQKPVLLQKKEERQSSPSSLLNELNFISNHNWNCIANMPVFLSTPLS